MKAQEAYVRTLREVNQLLVEVEELVNEPIEYEPDWGNVGDMQHIKTELESLVKFLEVNEDD